MKRVVLILLLTLSACVAADDQPGAVQDQSWYETDANGAVKLKLWFFWSSRCPHCLKARPVVERLAQQHDWLELESLELVNSSENRVRYREMALRFGEEPRSVPAFFFCNTMMLGFDSEAGAGRYISSRLAACKRSLEQGSGLPARIGPEEAAARQLAGSASGLDLDNMSLPVITLVIAGLDAFNPCAFFVLLFLLSLMIHVRSRRRMLLVGGVFVLCSGLVYFLFMAAWLNIFLLFGAMRWVTLIAGVVAVIMAAFNIKDFFYSGGASLSIPEQAKSGLIQRMRSLLNAESLPTMLTGTVLLAIIANTYELLCTSGLPMVYTRLLTLEQLPVAGYYFYLVAYNLIYVLPLLAIVIVFAATLGSRKLQAHEGRVLKLLSGMMMLGLGGVLVFRPDQLGNLAVIAGIIALAVLSSAVAYWVLRKHG